MRQRYYEHDVREVALREFILLPEEKVNDEQAQELAEKEAEHQKSRPVTIDLNMPRLSLTGPRLI
jgi:hypothetical protein